MPLEVRKIGGSRKCELVFMFVSGFEGWNSLSQEEVVWLEIIQVLYLLCLSFFHKTAFVMFLRCICPETSFPAKNGHRRMGVEGVASPVKGRSSGWHQTTLDGTSPVWWLFTVQPRPDGQGTTKRAICHCSGNFEGPLWHWLPNILAPSEPGLPLRVQVWIESEERLLWNFHGADWSENKS